MPKDEFATERKWFETWYNSQFKNASNLLDRDSSGAYKDDIVSGMFIGFCAAWVFK